jgi:pyrroloquinoline quinone biosynthesis protein D
VSLEIQARPSGAARPRLAARVRLQPDVRSGKLALLAPESVMLLNETSAAIVELCDGRTLDEIVQALAVRFAVPRERLLEDVTAYLGKLVDRGLVELGS